MGVGSLKQQWEAEDAFPDDDSRNRECEIRDPGPFRGVLKPGTSGSEYNILRYPISGRKGIHGTDQHTQFNVTADGPVDIFVSDGNETKPNIHPPQKNQTSKNETSTETTNTSTQEEDTSSPSGVSIIDEYTTRETQSHETMIEVPDGEEYIIIIAPSEKSNLTSEITVDTTFSCSYQLPFEEYKELRNSSTSE